MRSSVATGVRFGETSLPLSCGAAVDDAGTGIGIRVGRGSSGNRFGRGRREAVEVASMENEIADAGVVLVVADVVCAGLTHDGTWLIAAGAEAANMQAITCGTARHRRRWKATDHAVVGSARLQVRFTGPEII